MSDKPDIAVFGAGSWGTALAIQLARGGRASLLWGRAEDEPERLAAERRNQRYLPDAEFPAALQIEADFSKALECRDLLLVVPSHAFRQVLGQVREGFRPEHRVAWATKGLEQDTGMLPHQVARDVLGERPPLAVLSGPTFAREVGAGLPTAMTVAATDPTFGAAMAERIASPEFRTYTSNDLAGVEVGGAVKNVLAIAAGLSDGLGYGANTRIALISRGLAEMCRFGVALGAQVETFMGLSGMGDLVLTCTDNQSRNRRMGLGLAAGHKVEDVAKQIGQVVEGVYAAKAVHGVATKLGVEMPICEKVYQILYEDLPVSDAVTQLLTRELREEADPSWAPVAPDQ